MVNLKHPELAELTPTSFPPIASTDALWDLRSKACSSSQGSFTLQSHQRFLRRVLSPDAPTRGVLVVHGTGTGKTCTAIQVAEEYILRPEFQDKKVLVVASAAVQETFRDQLFDMSRVKLNDAGLLESKQCTGRRYLEMLTRIEQEPKNWANPEVRDRLERTADRIISEFYEFTAYASFGNLLTEKEALGDAPFAAWVHETFDNRLVVIDEAHNIRPKADMGTEKTITAGLEKLVKTANGMILVLLTATPMYESYDEVMLYFNLFRWNEHDRSKPFPEAMKASTFFDVNANLKKTKEAEFYRLCQDYVSYVRGENPFTFPFRLPPPPSASPLPTKPWKGDLYEPVRYLRLVDSPARGLQADVLQKTKGADTEAKQVMLMQPTVAVLPGNVDFKDAFTQQGTQWAYRQAPFLGPDKLPEVSAKFARVIQSINDGEGIAFVYSNYVTMGAQLFAMALEEHGYTPYRGKPNLANPAYKGPSKGSYVLLTSKESDKSIASLVSQARSESNRNGEKIRIIISSPLVAEGVDFRCVRQAHILDPWWNMSRIEQVVGRSLRTCSHTLLTNDKQNCTVYLHVIRTPDGKECYDEYTYRTKVVVKAEKIAKVRNILERAAMDCPFRVTLPDTWLDETFRVPQQQSEGRKEVTYSLRQMLPPSFDSGAPVTCIVRDEGPDPDHVRPLSSILDVRDELLDKLARLLQDKPIWDKDKLLEALKPYTRDVSLYTIQQSIEAGTRFQDAFNRQSVLESKGSLVVLRPVETADSLRITTLADRLRKQTIVRGEADLPTGVAPEPEPVKEIAPDVLATKRAEAKFPGDATTRFEPEILDAYVFDHLFTEVEKRAYLRATPEFGDRLRVPGTDILIRGNQQYDPDELPIGEEKTRVDEWTAALATKFMDVIAKNTIFASLSTGNKFTISKLKKVSDTEVVRGYTPDSRTFLPTTCGTGGHSKDVMVAFAKTVDKRGVGIPEGVSTVGDICIYSELLAREQTKCVWFTPEELSVLYGDTDLKDKFTAAFKKTKPS
jgi:superfamily II DNA or RNA helicase